ncbi:MULTISPECIES: hypothetical protein [Okeania]|uniref:Uncharacterized protein n=1 Tax=Okeania hirsuta TaxID=1458930 RepID=A0A3N6PB78_9CYAN|nr:MULTISPECIES: hypothetical protein [Okeania]NES93050.1 hypothetical protein [Okeania sp. SIO2B9]RQH24061.1 hypothetical protein D4Z78_05040 [Okeania hirsuta]RQH40832.1 hypothetical protein D5R40_16105 [Okeania hirsuta]
MQYEEQLDKININLFPISDVYAAITLYGIFIAVFINIEYRDFGLKAEARGQKAEAMQVYLCENRYKDCET